MEDNIIISSRVRLARNLDGYLFPNKMKKEEAREIMSNIFNSLGDDFTCLKTAEISRDDSEAYVEKHLISRDLIDNIGFSGVALSEDHSVSIMVNEEDHLRLQCIMRGMNVAKAYDIINDIDTELSGKINYAFDKKLGYITACPGNLGTGMRASVMMFLPALTMTNNISQVANSVSKLGLCIRGAYGEGSGAMGDLYQVSNQYTLGKSEAEIIQIVESTVLKIVDLEKEARMRLMELKGDEIRDNAMRAYGILTNCYKLSSAECLNYISTLKFGLGVNALKVKDEKILNSLLDEIMPASLNKLAGKRLRDDDRDKFRAQYVNAKLKDIRI